MDTRSKKFVQEATLEVGLSFNTEERQSVDRSQAEGVAGEKEDLDDEVGELDGEAKEEEEGRRS
jgi:hypothetical protein